MEKNEVIALEDRGFIQINGPDAKDFLQNIITNNIEKVNDKSTLFSSILTPQGKYLFEFFVLKFNEGYLLECEKKSTEEIIKLLKFYKLRSQINLINFNEKYGVLVISLEKFKEINSSNVSLGSTINYKENLFYVDPRSEELGAKIVTRTENINSVIKNLDLKISNKQKYYNKSFELGIPQIDLDKLKDKVFGIENNLDELNGIDFKKGCYIGQENTSRIKLRNKLRRRILPIKKVSGEIYENDIIKFKNIEIGKVLISNPYSFALVKVVDPNLEEFKNGDLFCGKSKIKILKPNWI